MQPDRHEPDEPDEPGDADDRAWRSIVENYGARAELDDPPATPPGGPAAPGAPVAPSTAPFGGRFGDLRGVDGLGGIGEDEEDPFLADEEGYEPPPPPPVPRATADRLAAWVGIFGSPVVLLAALIFSISLPTWLGYLLVAGFVGGFVYLVYRMPRGPRDPWDDGAQV